ncbi:MAG TPA: twin-arginine translocation signal domain-containing protein [Acidimicrobiales bacterium]|jgi:hypothetical protein|nr:twin-arginine translocation signal domain-containing protein [Acidimicrobiales bacterium]
MPEVTRRQFIRNASIGAAAAGVLAVGGPGILSAVEATVGGSPSALPPSQEPNAQEGSDVFARVIDAKAGHIKIFVGERSVDYTDQTLAQTLLQAAR